MATETDAVAFARRFKGVKESPEGSNHQRFGVWYGMDGVPWCAIFASYVLYTIGLRIKGASTAKGWSYCPSIVAWGKKNGRISHTPHVGDLAVLVTGVRPHHVELVSKVNSATRFTSVGGNTGDVDISNGGMVMEHSHDTKDWVFVKPPYDGKAAHAAPAVARTTSPVHRNLALTSPLTTGDDVGWVQNRLRQLGFLTEKADKAYGPNTAKAVQAFQKHTGLKADGVCGPVTGEHLKAGK